jgi:putative transposase
MRKSKFTESQIFGILAEGESELAVGDFCRKYGVSNATHYHWKSEYAGVLANELKLIKDLEAENGKLKRMYAVSVR